MADRPLRGHRDAIVLDCDTQPYCLAPQPHRTDTKEDPDNLFHRQAIAPWVLPFHPAASLQDMPSGHPCQRHLIDQNDVKLPAETAARSCVSEVLHGSITQVRLGAAQGATQAWTVCCLPGGSDAQPIRLEVQPPPQAADLGQLCTLNRIMTPIMQLQGTPEATYKRARRSIAVEGHNADVVWRDTGFAPKVEEEPYRVIRFFPSRLQGRGHNVGVDIQDVQHRRELVSTSVRAAEEHLRGQRGAWEASGSQQEAPVSDMVKQQGWGAVRPVLPQQGRHCSASGQGSLTAPAATTRRLVWLAEAPEKLECCSLTDSTASDDSTSGHTGARAYAKKPSAWMLPWGLQNNDVSSCKPWFPTPCYEAAVVEAAGPNYSSLAKQEALTPEGATQEQWLRASKKITCATYCKRLHLTRDIVDTIMPHTTHFQSDVNNSAGSPAVSDVKYELLFRHTVHLVDEHGVSWPMKYEGVKCRSQRHYRLTNGWSLLMRAKNVQIGDTVTFERLCTESFPIFVYITAGPAHTQEKATVTRLSSLSEALQPCCESPGPSNNTESAAAEDLATNSSACSTGLQRCIQRAGCEQSTRTDCDTQMQQKPLQMFGEGSDQPQRFDTKQIYLFGTRWLVAK